MASNFDQRCEWRRPSRSSWERQWNHPIPISCETDRIHSHPRFIRCIFREDLVKSRISETPGAQGKLPGKIFRSFVGKTMYHWVESRKFVKSRIVKSRMGCVLYYPLNFHKLKNRCHVPTWTLHGYMRMKITKFNIHMHYQFTASISSHLGFPPLALGPKGWGIPFSYLPVFQLACSGPRVGVSWLGIPPSILRRYAWCFNAVDQSAISGLKLVIP